MHFYTCNMLFILENWGTKELNNLHNPNSQFSHGGVDVSSAFMNKADTLVERLVLFLLQKHPIVFAQHISL